MTDAELIARLRVNDPVCEEHFTANIAADRIEALIAEVSTVIKACSNLSQQHIAEWNRAEAAEAKLAKAVEALEALIQLAHDCEKELTEDLHHMDFCGESEPLTKARATLAEIKGESHE